MPEERNNVRANFYTDPVHGDVVELRVAGDPFNTTSLQKVTAEHTRLFPREWDAYQKDKPFVDHGGTPLTEVPGFQPAMTTTLALAGVHNAEQLAGLSDGHLGALGLGGRGLRDGARQFLASKAKDDEIEDLKRRLAEKNEAKAEDKPKAPAAAAADKPKAA